MTELNNIYYEFGQRLAKLRQKRGLSQYDLAGQLHMPQSTYAGYETGKRKITLELIKQFSLFFDVSPTFLVTGDAYPETHFSMDEVSHIKKYRVLDERGKEVVDTILNSQYDAVKPKSDVEKEIS